MECDRNEANSPRHVVGCHLANNSIKSPTDHAIRKCALSPNCWGIGVFDHGGSFGGFLVKGVNLGGFNLGGNLWGGVDRWVYVTSGVNSTRGFDRRRSFSGFLTKGVAKGGL